MYFASTNPRYLHSLRNWSLVTLSIIFLPLSLALVCLALAYRLFCGLPIEPESGRRSRIRILVTGVGMEKGLSLARMLYLGGCDVIGADFEHHSIPACGRYSSAVTRFYRLLDPDGNDSTKLYVDQVIDIVRRERIALWISCSGVATAIEDAMVMEALERDTSCKAIQFNTSCISRLDNKLEFVALTKELGLAGPKWHALRTQQDAGAAIASIRKDALRERKQVHDRYIVKSAGMDDKSRGSLPLLTTADLDGMSRVLNFLDYGDRGGWILQQFIEGGEEFCTHAIVIKGIVRAFVACPSASILMHYRQLRPHDPLFQAMLRFTEDFASAMYKKTGRFTGHLSFDFLLHTESLPYGVKKTLLPIECNPRCHTATILFRGLERSVTAAYLSTLENQTENKQYVVIPGTSEIVSFYWIAHDLVTLLIWPTIQLLVGRTPWKTYLSGVSTFLEHVLTWKEATFEWWDPLPFIVLNNIHWPLRLAHAAINDIKWKQLNVSTTKMFLA